MDIKKIQEKIWQNKVDKNFNTTNVEKEFCLTHGELSEAYQAYIKKEDDLGEEVADVAIYLLALAKMLNIDIQKEILKKIEKNEKREYKKINGVTKRVKEA
ncbi:MAG: Pyrophosphatase [candidate division WS6 bacterium 34_10]|uniref:Pyrophosphatase n=1 Tax=candidate division WS6 bacterium 34_10 TaxID=1641389 RepID=A0A101HGT1_9BACT|nr:MAG: Pyrophosphatase [candidate division WS6 bacterium 34_10]